MTPAEKKKQRLTPRVKVAITLVILVVLFAKCLSNSNGSFSASIENFIPLNSHQILVYVKVTNTGGSAGTASCNLTAFTPSRTNVAGENFQPDRSLQPGKSTVVEVTATVTGNAANQVEESGISASC